MLLIYVNSALLFFFAALLIYAAVQDVREYRIPNIIIIALLVLYPAYFLTSSQNMSLPVSFLIGGVFFLIGLGLFSTGVMGGGDVKLIAVTGLWVGASGLLPFLMVMALVGAVMSLFMMIMPVRLGVASFCTQMGFVSLQEKILTDRLPYGVAISAGGLFAAYQMAMAI